MTTNTLIKKNTATCSSLLLSTEMKGAKSTYNIYNNWIKKVSVMFILVVTLFAFISANEAQAKQDVDYGVTIKLEPGGDGPLGIRMIVSIQVKVGPFKIEVSDTVNLAVPQKNGSDSFRLATPADFPSTYHIATDEATISFPKGEEELPMYTIPVYQDDIFLGNLVNTEYYDMYPNAIAYLLSEGRSFKLVETDPEFLKPLIDEAKTNYSLKVTSQSDNKVIMEFDNTNNLNTKFDVFNTNGEVVKQITSNGNVLTIEDLPVGVYFIRSTTNHNLQQKIVINN